jgi:DNA repair protein SbcC/Rad50
MRILKLQFSNLNSLVGTWQIDFTDPAYTNEGIFAITGPTGAGKSTILDAICLALYGCTPRLKTISVNENEIMSRLTSLCSAEVTFQTQAGIFRCAWAQKLARGKIDGKRQAPTHEIVDARTGTVLESQIRKVAAKIVEVTGMDFNQFTRSMLLAQGSFATFLQANAADRAPVLEQITGTEIYSNLSIAIYERYALEKRELERLDIELGGMQLLSADEAEALRAELQRLKGSATGLSARAAMLRSIVAWHDAVAKLEQELAGVDAQLAQFAVRDQAAEPSRKLLKRAEQASVVDGYYLPVSKRRLEEAQLKSDSAILSDMHPKVIDSNNKARRCVEEARNNLARCRMELAHELEQWRRVRELDISIREKRKAHQDLLSMQNGIGLEQAAFRAKLGIHSALLEQRRLEKAKMQEYFQRHAVDASLGESMNAITVMIDGIQACAGKLDAKRSELAGLESGRELLTLERETAQRECETGMHDAQRAAQNAHECDERIERILDGKDIADHRSLLDELSKRETALNEALRLWSEMDAARTAVRSHEEKQTALMQARAQGIELITKADLEKQSMQADVDRHEETVLLLTTIESLNEQRMHLQDGVPCPLCGAQDHPYAHGQIPRIDEKREALKRAKEGLSAASEALQKYTVLQAAIERDITLNMELIAEKTELTSSLEHRCNAICSTLEIDCERSVMARETDAVRTHRQQTEQLVNAADQELEAQRLIHKEASVLQQNYHAFQIRYEQASLRLEQAQQNLQQLQGDCDGAAEELERLMKRLESEAAQYGFEQMTVETIARMGIELRTRKEAWDERSRAAEAIQVSEDEALSEIRSVEAVLENIDRQAAKSIDDVLRSSSACETIESERSGLFGDKDPDEEERARNKEAAELERILGERQKDAERCAKEVVGVETQISMMNNRMRECGSALALEEAELQKNLTVHGFANEEEFMAARIPDVEQSGLRLQIDALRDEGMRLESLRTQKRLEFRQEQEKKISNEEPEAAARELAGLNEDYEKVQQSIGALENQLRQNEEQQQAREATVKKKELQRKAYQRWDDLNELIGSASGKKFQKIAQAITFEIMVAQANVVLKKMSARYFLMCDREVDLEMNIVDMYQAGEIRSTKNLSGGESFIVSLSLALGLSHMASKNVRVDSLFLDEGFGTLDGEALDTALTTLGELKQDGKVIGVISHVDALKDRIGTQIVVTPDSGGRSHLRGPGCKRIN